VDVRIWLGRDGYTLVELTIALLLFAVGALALAGTSAVLGRALNVDAVRERAARVAATQIEVIAAQCHGAGSGHQSLGQIESNWSVSQSDSNRFDIRETVGYSASNGRRTDSYRALVWCP